MTTGNAPTIVEGKTWRFPQAHLNTDLMMPGYALRLGIDEQARAVFATIRPGWVDEVADGDVLVTGRNFGTGSSRPAAVLFQRLGIAAIVAESLNDIFFRNCVNHGLPAMECPGILDGVTEGDSLLIDFASGTVRNNRTSDRLTGRKLPGELLDIVRAGGLYTQLQARGLVE